MTPRNLSLSGGCFVCLLNPVWQTVLTRSLWHPGERSLEHAWILSLLSAARDQLMDHWGRMGCILLCRVLCQDASAKPVVPTSCEVITLGPVARPVLCHPAGSPSISLCCLRLSHWPLLPHIHGIVWVPLDLSWPPRTWRQIEYLAQTSLSPSHFSHALKTQQIVPWHIEDHEEAMSKWQRKTLGPELLSPPSSFTQSIKGETNSSLHFLNTSQAGLILDMLNRDED